MSGLWLWRWLVVVARQAGGRVEERSAGERSVLPRRAPRVTVTVQVRTLTNYTALAARPVWPGNFGCCFVWTIHNLSAQLGVKSFVFFSMEDRLRLPTCGLLTLLSRTVPPLRELRLTILMLSHTT